MPSPDLMDVRARPRGGQVAFIAVVAIAAGAGGTWMARALDTAAQPGWTIAIGIGLGITLGVFWFAMQGSRVTVSAERVLTYSLHGRANISVDLAQITAVRPIADGLVRGIGVELADVRQVRFLHKAGISPERMRQWRGQLGVDLVLEGFGADAAELLERLRRP